MANYILIQWGCETQSLCTKMCIHVHLQGNILLDGKGHAFLSDFGAAKFLGSHKHTLKTKEAVGTVYYL